jgi:multiple sugar transport system permease protein
MTETAALPAVDAGGATQAQTVGGNRASRYLLAALCVFLIALMLAPLIVSFFASIKTPTDASAVPPHYLPHSLSLENYRTVAHYQAGLWTYVANSLTVAFLTIAFCLLLSVPAGYALARYAFRGADAYRLLILMTRAFPIAILALPLTVTFIRWGLYDTPLGVALVHTALALPFAVLVSSSLFMGIPRELEEAAWVFGCSRAQAFRRVVLPLALPGIAATAIFAFVISWNEVFAASVLTVRQRTLTAYLIYSLGESPLHFKFAGGLFLIVPVLVFIFAVRRYLFSMWGIASR